MTTDLSKQATEDKFTGKVRRALDDSAADLDELTLARLRAARANAVAAAEKKTSGHSYWLPAAGFATVLVAVSAVLLTTLNNGEVMPGIDGDDLEMLSSIDSLDLLDNMDFYEWLEADAESAG
ncbi:MAG: hypothetical protein BMS9Abin26_2163 [Gammaproteobacteria bacterium]|nr:MAG: hypothetical protein BMS9Abin26_2163 [Gammaproteobacteria bacterium]